MLYFNTAEDELTLPDKDDVKREFFNLLRDCVKPNVVKADKWRTEFGETHWKKALDPTTIWPAPSAGPSVNPGECPVSVKWGGELLLELFSVTCGLYRYHGPSLHCQM